MPRRGRGGRRTGTPGRPYPNRRDLAQNAQPQAVQAPTGQPYGQRQAQVNAQRAIPLPRSSPAMVLPGSLGGMDRPSERPAEPLTAGLPVGPGPGPEALTGLPRPQAVDSDLLALRDYLPALEVMANQPGTSVAARNFVRRLRGAMPSEV